MSNIRFEVKFVPAGTGAMVWDHPNADQVVQRFMPAARQHGPMVGILHFGAVRPTPGVLRDAVVTIGEEVRAGRYGDFSFIVSSEDGATRSIVSDIASAQDLPIFVTSSPIRLDKAEAVGVLTVKDRETLTFVMQAGGTVTATEFAARVGVEQTTAGNRLIALNKKGYLQRVERPHPFGDQFVDPRSVRFDIPS